MKLAHTVACQAATAVLASLISIGFVGGSTAARAQADNAVTEDAFRSGFDDLMTTIAESEAKIGELKDLAAELEGEDRLLVERQLWQRRLDLHASVRALVSNMQSREAQGDDLSAVKPSIAERLKLDFPTYGKQIDSLEEELRSLRTERDSVSPADRLALEQKLTGVETQLQTLFRVSLEFLAMMEAVDVDASAERTELATRLVERADGLSGRIDLATEELQSIAERAKDDGDEAVAELRRATERRLDGATDALAETLALMASLDLDTAEYQQLLFETTGELTTGIFNTKVMLGLLRSWRELAWERLSTRGPGWLLKAVVFLVILTVFRVAAGIVRRVARRTLQLSTLKLSQLLQENLVSGLGHGVMALGLLVALSQLGVRLGPLLAGLGIAGFVLGFALQDTLSNFAAGAMILIYRPFDVGDSVEAAGVAGKVNRLSLVSTTILTFDNQTLIVPNGKIWGDVIRNITAQSRRRVDLVFGIGYGDDIARAEAILTDIVAKHDKVLADPPPVVKLHTLGESSVDFIVRPWTQTGDYWEVYWDLTREVKMRFDRENVSIPFPQRDVHLYREADALASA